jgi:hypothetical protein
LPYAFDIIAVAVMARDRRNVVTRESTKAAVAVRAKDLKIVTARENAKTAVAVTGRELVEVRK